MPFEWTINPYRGCEFACKYCYARYTHEYMEFHSPEDFERRIFAKQFDRAAFAQKLRRIAPEDRIAIGTATDPYQPAERTYAITHSILEIMASLRGREVSLVTKSDLVRRDADLLARIARRNKLYVSLTVTTIDAELARKLEPGAPRPDLRLEAVAALRAAGVPAGVLCCPVMPLINDTQEQLNALASAAAQAGAQWLGANIIFLTSASRKMFFPFLAAEFPHLERRYQERFAQSAYLHGSCADAIKDRVRKARLAFGLTSSFPEYEPAGWSRPVQLTLPL
jgi:DNA repair photolyase